MNWLKKIVFEKWPRIEILERFLSEEKGVGWNKKKYNSLSQRQDQIYRLRTFMRFYVTLGTHNTLA